MLGNINYITKARYRDVKTLEIGLKEKVVLCGLITMQILQKGSMLLKTSPENSSMKKKIFYLGRK